MSGTQTTAFALYLREHASRYFKDFGAAPVNVQLVSRRTRPASMLYRFSVGTAARHRFVLVKVPLMRGGARNRTGGEGESPAERPRLTSNTDPAIKFQLEYAALVAIYDYFDGINDPRFGAIRVLDLLPDQRAIVMEEVGDPSLRQLFIKASRLCFPLASVDLDASLRNAGAWLRAYHALPKQDHVKPCHTQRPAFIELVSLFTDFLANTVGDELFFRDIASRAVASALEVLPESLPLGLRHGDYTLRNILVGPNNRITVLDTPARWRTPIYEDIAYFLLGLKTNLLQVVSQGLAFDADHLDRYEHEFLVGYYGQEIIPFRTIRLYEVLALLDKWSSQASYTNNRILGGSAAAVERTLRLALLNRFFQRTIDHLLRDADRV